MYWFIHLGVTSEINPWDAYSPGRLDQHLIGFYNKDIAGGILDRNRAKELLECLWVKFNNQPAPPKVGITLKESSTYTDFTIQKQSCRNSLMPEKLFKQGSSGRNHCKDGTEL